MKQQDALRAEYLEFARLYGYVPEFPTSIDATIRDLVEAEDDGRLSPLGRDMLTQLKRLTAAEVQGAEAGLDPGGYADFLNTIEVSGCISGTTLRRTFCAEFPTGDFNACARRSQHGYICLLNQGLRNLLFRVSMAVWSAYGEEDRDKPSFHESLEYVLEVCYRYLTTQVGPAETEIRHGPFAIKTGSSIARSMRLFVVAHEVAHAELGHLDAGTKYSLASPVGAIEVLAKGMRQELEADALAQEVLTRVAEKTAPNPDGSGGSLLIVCGGVCFLTVEMIVSCCRLRMSRQSEPPPSTHPPSKDRISALFGTLQGRISAMQLKQLRSIQSAYGRVYDAFLQLPM